MGGGRRRVGLAPPRAAVSAAPPRHSPAAPALLFLAQVDEIANLAAYLCSDYAAWVSGQIITLDGGETALNAGEFNALRQVTAQEWDMMEAMIRNVNKKGS